MCAALIDTSHPPQHSVGHTTLLPSSSTSHPPTYITHTHLMCAVLGPPPSHPSPIATHRWCLSLRAAKHPELELAHRRRRPPCAQTDQYRLCPAGGPLTEECFMKQPLEFVRTKQQLRWS